MSPPLRIGELARATGVEVETIRYYEKAGLLPPPARQSNGYRAYGAAHLERLAFIRHCRALDMPLADVQRLLDFTHSDDNACPEINALIDAQFDAAAQSYRERCGEVRSLDFWKKYLNLDK